MWLPRKLSGFQPNYPPVKKRLSVLAKGTRATGTSQKGHCGRGTTSGGRSVACAHRTQHRRPARPNYLTVLSSRGTVLERGVCPASNLVRSSPGDSHRRFRLNRAPFRFTETE